MRDIRLLRCWSDELGPRDPVASFVNAVVQQSSPEQIAIIRVRDWFGPNWHRFSGKVLGVAGARARQVENVALPPFVPERVLAEAWWQRNPNQEYVSYTGNAKLNIQQLSERNLRRRAPHVLGPNAIALWLGRGGNPERVALLVIDTCGEEANSWYAESELKDDDIAWGKCAGISHRELKVHASHSGGTARPE